MEYFILILKTIFVLNVAITLASLCTWFERKVSALIQDRVGANRAGTYLYTDKWYLKPIFVILRLFGILGFVNTFFCDPLKAIMKEDYVPKGVSNFLHSLAPFAAALPIFIAFAVIPFAPDFTLFGYEIRMQLAPLNAAMLFVFAMGSVAVYGVALAGWTSNNKFALLGALRASAQMISYELTMGLSFLAIIAIYQTLDLHQIVEMQKNTWGIFLHPLAWLTFIILFVVGMAETKRGPFDMPEAESELVAGYFTEYSGMKFLLFWMGEFAEIALFSLLVVIFFFGGWHLPGLDLSDGSWVSALIGHVVLMSKVVFFCILQIVIRWSLPRFRYDQLMTLGWKYLLPMSLVNLLASAWWILYFK